jgi:hypothetical protein
MNDDEKKKKDFLFLSRFFSDTKRIIQYLRFANNNKLYEKGNI